MCTFLIRGVPVCVSGGGGGKQDRDGVIAAVEDARAAQEEETERLRNQLKELNHDPTQSVPELSGWRKQTNGTASSSSVLEFGHESGRNSMKALNGGSRDLMVEGEEVGGLTPSRRRFDVPLYSLCIIVFCMRGDERETTRASVCRWCVYPPSVKQCGFIAAAPAFTRRAMFAVLCGGLIVFVQPLHPLPRPPLPRRHRLRYR